MVSGCSIYSECISVHLCGDVYCSLASPSLFCVTASSQCMSSPIMVLEFLDYLFRSLRPLGWCYSPADIIKRERKTVHHVLVEHPSEPYAHVNTPEPLRKEQQLFLCCVEVIRARVTLVSDSDIMPMKHRLNASFMWQTKLETFKEKH